MTVTFLAGALLAAGAHSMTYEPPGVEICSSSTSRHCELMLDVAGNIVDASDGRVVLSGMSSAAISDSYSLLKVGANFVLEHQNASPSKNWAILVFKYANHVAIAQDYISLSRSTGPSGLSWKGQECRGDATLTSAPTPFHIAYSSLCGGKMNQAYEKTAQNPVATAASRAGLAVTIPVFESKTNVWTRASYVFVSNDLPDAGTMLCLADCRQMKGNQRLGGWIDKSLWVNATFKKISGDHITGSYMYLRNKISIEIDGAMTQDGIDVKEYDMEGKARASFVGRKYGDAYVGTWSSVDGKRKYSFFLAPYSY